MMCNTRTRYSFVFPPFSLMMNINKAESCKLKRASCTVNVKEKKLNIARLMNSELRQTR